MPIMRTTVTFKAATGFAKDDIVNTFWFSDGDGEMAPTAAADIGGNLSSFYNTIVSGTGSNIANFLSPYLSRDADAVHVRTYDMSLPKFDRIPHSFFFTLGAAGSTSTLPEEVAITCSFHGAAPVKRTERGRIYIGPLTVQALASQTGKPTRVLTNLQTIITGACARLKTDTDADLRTWNVFSQKLQQVETITGGFVDDAFDTQRRRGPAPLARVSWGS